MRMQLFNPRKFDPGAKHALVAMILAGTDIDDINEQSVMQVINSSHQRSEIDMAIGATTGLVGLLTAGATYTVAGAVTAMVAAPVSVMMLGGFCGWYSFQYQKGREEELKIMKNPRIGRALVHAVQTYLDRGCEEFAVAMAAQRYIDTCLITAAKDLGNVKFLPPGRAKLELGDGFIADMEDEPEYNNSFVEDEYEDEEPEVTPQPIAPARSHSTELIDILVSGTGQPRFLMGPSQVGKSSIVVEVAKKLKAQGKKIIYINLAAIEISELESIADQAIAVSLRKHSPSDRSGILRSAIGLVKSLAEATQTVLIVDEVTQWFTGVEMLQDCMESLSEALMDHSCDGNKRKSGILLCGTIPVQLTKPNAAILDAIQVLPMISNELRLPDGTPVELTDSMVASILKHGKVKPESFQTLNPDEFSRAVHLGGTWYAADRISTFKEPTFRPDPIAQPKAQAPVIQSIARQAAQPPTNFDDVTFAVAPTRRSFSPPIAVPDDDDWSDF